MVEALSSLTINHNYNSNNLTTNRYYTILRYINCIFFIKIYMKLRKHFHTIPSIENVNLFFKYVVGQFGNK